MSATKDTVFESGASDFASADLGNRRGSAAPAPDAVFAALVLLATSTAAAPMITSLQRLALGRAQAVIKASALPDQSRADSAGVPDEVELRAEFVRQHVGRDLNRHRLRGTYTSANIAALWNQHKRTAEWMAARSPVFDNDRISVSAAAKDVLAERRRQVAQEGYGTEHDDAYPSGEIAAYAAFYAMPPAAREWPATETGYGETFGEAIVPADWTAPKTGDRRRELVKAGALILAELERLDRAALRTTSTQPTGEKGGAA